jgi:predicted nucleic acid-binding protein
VIHLDSTFLIDLLREGRRGRRGPATELLESQASEEVGVSVFVLCELWAGVEISGDRGERSRVEALIDALDRVDPDERVAATYGKALASLRARGESIATMDLLIASTALVAGSRLVTRNLRHFERVPGLEVLSY